MTADTPILIAGAGPVGLAAAMFLKQLGVTARIVDPKPEPAQTSNALGVNPRTLELLEPTGVTDRILAEALPMDRLVVHQAGKRLGEIHLAPQEDVGANFPMVILPQWRTEALLTEALAAEGIAPERGLKLAHFEQDDSGVRYTLEGDGGEQTGRAAVLFAADGAHSMIRHALNLGFPGSAFPETWKVIDVEVEQPDDPHGVIDFRPEGPFIALPYSRTHWRLIGTGNDDLAHALPPGWTLKSVQWSSDFHIAHRIATQLNVGRVCLAGDAAHIHAPVGARGMNLGIEDAYVFAQCAADFLNGGADRLADYGRLRHEADEAVVKKVEAVTRAARAKGPLAEAIRPFAVPLIGVLPPLMHLFERTATGLDHEVKLS